MISARRGPAGPPIVRQAFRAVHMPWGALAEALGMDEPTLWHYRRHPDALPFWKRLVLTLLLRLRGGREDLAIQLDHETRDGLLQGPVARACGWHRLSAGMATARADLFMQHAYARLAERERGMRPRAYSAWLRELVDRTPPAPAKEQP